MPQDIGMERFSGETEAHLERVRRVCLSLADVTEKLSHGEPTFFVRKRVFVMFANNHHGDGRVAIWIPVEQGMQSALIESSPETYFYPPYVGVNGWVGVILDAIDDENLGLHVHQAWQYIREKSKAKRRTAS